MQTLLIASGYALANWVGVFGSFASGSAAWSVLKACYHKHPQLLTLLLGEFPLGIQCVPAVILIVGLFRLPESLGWLIQNGRDAEAYAVADRVHDSATKEHRQFAEKNFTQMKQQIEYEREVFIKSWTQLFKSSPSDPWGIAVSFLANHWYECRQLLSDTDLRRHWHPGSQCSVGISGIW